MLVLVTFNLFVFYFAGGIASLTKPCVPTEKMEGPCHQCVCGIDGVYNCHRRKQCIEDRSEMNFIFRDKCEPLAVYVVENVICICSHQGLWRSNACLKIFHYIRPIRFSSPALLRSMQSCTPNNLYLIECNICTCGDDGKLNACTSRQCAEGTKISTCERGDILRTTDELCVCSDINYFIDRLCISVQTRRIQKIHGKQLVSLLDGKSKKINTPFHSTKCNIGDSAKVDCNRCFCVNGNWACQSKKCLEIKDKDVARGRKTEFLKLPKVVNDTDKCIPHKKYRYKCNTCICTEKEALSCTTMICLDFLKDD